MSDIIFDVLKPEYIKSLSKLETMCFTVPWTAEMFAKDVSNPDANYVLAIKDAKVIGYCGLYYVLDEGYITNIAIHPDYRKKGIGNIILNKIIDFCIKKNFSFVTLEVRESNSSALKLYIKNGFTIVGQRKNYYSDNHETAILMTKFLKEV